MQDGWKVQRRDTLINDIYYTDGGKGRKIKMDMSCCAVNFSLRNLRLLCSTSNLVDINITKSFKSQVTSHKLFPELDDMSE